MSGLSSEREAEIRAEAEEGFALTDWEARGLLAALDYERGLSRQLAEALELEFGGPDANPRPLTIRAIRAYREARS